jgi:isoquinoline 1-oxidoreductase beta subunit
MCMILAEELEADWTRMKIVQADSEAKYGDMVTGGSASVRTSWEPLRNAGAAGREMLILAAAKEWGVPAAECVARDEAVHHAASKRSAKYGTLAVKAAKLPVPKTPALKDPKDFKIVGMSEPRVDGPKIVVGAAKYGVDTKLPGMLYAVTARSPVFLGKVKKFDGSKALAVGGVKKVVEVPAVEMTSPFSFGPAKEGNQHFLPSGVAVIADSTWQALQGRKALEIEWDELGHGSENTSDQRAKCAELAQKPGQEVNKVGDADAAFAKAATKLEAVYELPFLAHTPMEPPNCTAYFKDGHCTIWAPTQNAQGVLAAVAHALGIPTSNVTVHVTLMGGGFGRRLNVDYGVEAALISKEAGAPVKVFWTREDDIRFDYYRPMSLHRMRAGIDESGQVAAWMHHIVAPTTDGYYEGPESPDVSGSELAGPGLTCGAVPNYLLECSFLETAVPRGYLRAVDHLANRWAVDCFLDEIAVATKKDPVALRGELFGEWHEMPAPKNPDDEVVDVRRLRKVINFAAEKSGWGTPMAERRGRGIAGSQAFSSYVAQVAEVTVAKSGAVKVDRIVLAIDCGRVVNPDIASAQLEGGVIMGLTSALRGEITLADGRVQQSNFNNYKMLRISEVPKIEIYFVASEEAPSGLGELGVLSVAPALGNAIFMATGKRVRSLPFRTGDLALS